MAGKCKPFKPEEWPEVVEQASGISNDAYWLPVSTLLMGLPGETSDDIAKKLELTDDLKKCWIMFYPLLIVPPGRLSEEDCTKDKLLPEHCELVFRCWEINPENLAQNLQRCIEWAEIFSNRKNVCENLARRRGIPVVEKNPGVYEKPPGGQTFQDRQKHLSNETRQINDKTPQGAE